MDDELVGEERHFIHKLTNALSIAHGSVHAVQALQERDPHLAMNPMFTKRLKSACAAVDQMVEILEVRRNHLESLLFDSDPSSMD